MKTTMFTLGVIFTLLVITAIECTFYGFSLTKFLPLTTPIILGGSVVVATSLFFETRARNKKDYVREKSKEHLDACVTLLERAYEIFTSNGENKDSIKPSRRLWLNTARTILRYYDVKDSVTAVAHNTILAEHEAYWRIHFQNVLEKNLPVFELGYFKPHNHGDDEAEEIDRDSMIVIFDFHREPEDYQDPIRRKDLDTAQMVVNKAIPKIQKGVWAVLRQDESFKARLREIGMDLDG